MKNLLILGLALHTVAANAQWNTLPLSNGRCQQGLATNYNNLYLVGGYDPSFVVREDVLVYDRLADQWSTSPLELSVARRRLACAITGDKLVCAGGFTVGSYIESGAAEVFDLTNNSVEQVTQLSVPRTGITVATVGGRIFFAGGTDIQAQFPLACQPYDEVDIYDGATGLWSVEHLSQARFAMATAVLGDKVFFAGGHFGSAVVSDRVDIYDNATGLWSTATLSVPRAFYGGGVAVGSKAMFAGGLTDLGASSAVDIYDGGSGTWSTASISVARAGIQAAAVGNYAIFSGGGELSTTNWAYDTSLGTVDVYDVSGGTWADVQLSAPRVNFASAASGNQVFVTGGYGISSGTVVGTMDVFTDASQIGIEEPSRPRDLNAWPDPFVDVLNIGNLDALNGSTVEVYDARGARAASVRLGNSLSIDLSFLDDGLYELRVLKSDGSGVIARGSVIKAR